MGWRDWRVGLSIAQASTQGTLAAGACLSHRQGCAKGFRRSRAFLWRARGHSMRRFGVSGILWRARSVAGACRATDAVAGSHLSLFIVNELPVGISGLFIAAIFAAAISTLDSALTESSDLTVNHIYQRLLPQRSEAHYLLVSRLFMVLWGLLFLRSDVLQPLSRRGFAGVDFQATELFLWGDLRKHCLSALRHRQILHHHIGLCIGNPQRVDDVFLRHRFFLLVPRFWLVDGRRGLGFRSSRLGTQWRGNALVPT